MEESSATVSALPPVVSSSSTSLTPSVPTASSSASPPPSQTLYLKNLNEKTAIATLRKDLYLLFSQFGDVLEVRAVRSDHLRGQAWVLLSDVSDAVRALREMDGFVMYGRPMRCLFARHESDALIRARGGSVPKREKRQRPSTKELKAAKLRQAAQQQTAAAAAGQHPLPVSSSVPGFPAPALPFVYPPSLLTAPPPLPNRILFVESLPPSLTLPALSALFSPHSCYVESRLVPVRPGVAFVEFEDERAAAEAMTAMQAWKVEDGYAMRISYAKR